MVRENDFDPNVEDEQISQSDYADYYDEYYGEFDEQKIEREYHRKRSMFSRGRLYINDVRTNITNTINSEIDLQKEYYADKENDVLYYQQLNRNRIFYRKLIGAVLTGGVIVGLLYLFLILLRR